MIAAAAATELWPEVGLLDLFEVPDLPPGPVAYGAGNVDFELKDRHQKGIVIDDCRLLIEEPALKT